MLDIWACRVRQKRGSRGSLELAEVRRRNVDVNMFVLDTVTLWETDASELSVEHQVDRVCKASGCTELFESFSDYTNATENFPTS